MHKKGKDVEQVKYGKKTHAFSSCFESFNQPFSSRLFLTSTQGLNQHFGTEKNQVGPSSAALQLPRNLIRNGPGRPDVSLGLIGTHGRHNFPLPQHGGLHGLQACIRQVDGNELCQH